MSKRDIGGIILPIETSGLESELNEKIEFFENEHHRLKVELLIESRPTARYHIAKNMREALAKVENIKKLLETIREPSESIGNHTKLTLVDAIPNSTKNPSSRKKQYGIKENKSINLLHRPIGYIGITALAGVLTVLVVYLIKKHFGIPLQSCTESNLAIKPWPRERALQTACCLFNHVMPARANGVRSRRDLVIAARQIITAEWWDARRHQYHVFISTLVENEISKGDPKVAQTRFALVDEIPALDITDQANALAKDLIALGSVPKNSEEDALHIGIAAAAGMDYLLTWNFKHINNAETRQAIATVIEQQGFVCPVLCSPEELGP